MIMQKPQLESEVFALLKDWCDGLLKLQIDMPGQDDFDGAILCPACKVIHGRCHDAVYPLLCMADRTGDDRYLTAAKKLFRWGGNMLCDDGSLYNDGHSAWNGITVFNAVALHDALVYHGHLLDSETKAAWEARLRRMSEWLYSRLTVGVPTNINYFATNSCAMALLGKYYGREDYIELSRSLLKYCLDHLSENLLLYGEGKPIDGLTAKGCRAIDVGGYNVEESLPSLCRAAMELSDQEALEKLTRSYRAHLEWMLPDGAWDNSVGTRNFKWTYWGSRTSDGCQEALFRLGKRDPVFAEAALRNLRLYEKCTHDGLLYGGPDYHRHDERPCVHHSFCHAKVLAGALDEGLCDLERVSLPSDGFRGRKYYPELDTWRVGCGPWRADVTAYDFDYMTGGHASGGALSLLWHEACGPVVAVGAVDYSLHEAHNQQLSVKKAEHHSLCPRIELIRDGKRWGQHYDYRAKMTVDEGTIAENAADAESAQHIHVDAFLCDDHCCRIDGDGSCSLDYYFTPAAVRIGGTVSKTYSAMAEYNLPVIAEEAAIQIQKGTLAAEPDAIFNLNPGFMGREYRIRPDADGEFVLEITVRKI
ncbi:MAG: hypothetical protein IJK56_09250 [Firmicutes bacterium]|nr:hypothetical protein [Bacillota bacterium]